MQRPEEVQKRAFERRTSSPRKRKIRPLTESGPQTPDEAPVNAGSRQDGCGRHYSANYVADVRRLSLLPEASREIRSTFSHDDRKIIGRRASHSPHYNPNPTRGCPSWFLSMAGVLCGQLDTARSSSAFSDKPMRMASRFCRLSTCTGKQIPAAPEAAIGNQVGGGARRRIGGDPPRIVWEENGAGVTWRRSLRNGPRAGYSHLRLSKLISRCLTLPPETELFTNSDVPM